MKAVIFLLSATMMLISCADSNQNKKIKKVEFVFTKEGSLTLYKPDGQTLKTLDIEFAETPYERETGLMHRTSMKDDQGMLFIFSDEFPRSFFMKNTLIPLDIIYLDANKQIVSFRKNAKPLDETSLPSDIPAMYVLEVNAGLVDKWKLEVGDTMTFTRN